MKLCEWTRKSLNSGRGCYKMVFYGIRSHRCMQCTPALNCNLACRFCWRVTPTDAGVGMDELEMPEWDAPEEMVEGMVAAQRDIVSGFKGDGRVSRDKWEEARDPAHVALSLTGEPMLYPMMSELLAAFHKRKFSTFLVTNGTRPESLEGLETLPTQLYLSLQAPDRKTYLRTTRPQFAGAWERNQESLAVMRGLRGKTRRVLRMTLVKGLNMNNAEGYAAQIGLAEPEYVEVKAFSFVGGSRLPGRGLSMKCVPAHEEIKAFAQKLSQLTGYIPSAEHIPSRVVLLCRDDKAAEERIMRFER